MAKKVWGQETSKGGQVGYIKWQKGTTTIRIVGEGDEHYVHWCENADGKIVKVICPGKNECPVCQELNRQREESLSFIEREDSEFFKGLEDGRLTKQIISDRVKALEVSGDSKSKSLLNIYEGLLNIYEKSAKSTTVAYVIDRSEGDVKIAELKKSIIDGIDTLAKDDDYGNPAGYDIKVTKSGEGRFGVKYTVMPGKQSPLTESEQNAVESLPELSDLHKPHTKDEIMAMNLTILSNDEEIPV